MHKRMEYNFLFLFGFQLPKLFVVSIGIRRTRERNEMRKKANVIVFPHCESIFATIVEFYFRWLALNRSFGVLPSIKYWPKLRSMCQRRRHEILVVSRRSSQLELATKIDMIVQMLVQISLLAQQMYHQLLPLAPFLCV